MSIILSLIGDTIPDDLLARQTHRRVARISGKDVVRIFGTRIRARLDRDSDWESGIQVYNTRWQLSEIESIEGLRPEDLREYRVPDLMWVPPRNQFEKLFRNPQVPVFYILQVMVVA